MVINWSGCLFIYLRKIEELNDTKFFGTDVTDGFWKNLGFSMGSGIVTTLYFR